MSPDGEEMAYTPKARLLQTTVDYIELIRVDSGPNRLECGPVYRVGVTVNGTPYSMEIRVLPETGYHAEGRPKVFGPLKDPESIIAEVVRRFSEGESFTFPIDLGDIGEV